MDNNEAVARWRKFSHKWLEEKPVGRKTTIGSKEIHLTAGQIDCIDNLKLGDLLVQGAAGSGKSVVLVEHARTCAEKFPNASVAILTYVNTLVAKLRTDVGVNYPNLMVETIDVILNKIYFALRGRRINYDSDYSAGIESRIKYIQKEYRKKTNSTNRLLEPEWVRFLYDEFVFMKRKLFKTLDTYSKPKARAGRGDIKLSAEEKEIVFSMYLRFYEIESKNLQKSKSDNVSLENPDVALEYIIDNREAIPDDLKIDYVMIDESQDLTINKLAFAKVITRKQLTIVADKAQNIYRSGFTFKQANIDIRKGQSKKLESPFRNTKQILALAKCFSANYVEFRDEEEEIVNATMPEAEGEKPKLYYVESISQEKEQLVNLIREKKAVEPDAGVAVIIQNIKGDSSRSIFEMEKYLTNAGIHCCIIDQSSKKHQEQLLDDSVKLVRYHSSKGLEFDHVILPFVEKGVLPNVDLEKDKDVYVSQVNLFYVGLTRAMKTVSIIAIREKASEFLSKLDDELVDEISLVTHVVNDQGTLEITDIGTSTEEMSFAESWEDAKDYLDKDEAYTEYNNYYAVAEHMEDYPAVKKPFKNVTFKVTDAEGNCVHGKCDYAWPDEKLMVFFRDNSEHMLAARKTDWQVLYLPERSFSWQSLFDKIKV